MIARVQSDVRYLESGRDAAALEIAALKVLCDQRVESPNTEREISALTAQNLEKDEVIAELREKLRQHELIDRQKGDRGETAVRLTSANDSKDSQNSKLQFQTETENRGKSQRKEPLSKKVSFLGGAVSVSVSSGDAGPSVWDESSVKRNEDFSVSDAQKARASCDEKDTELTKLRALFDDLKSKYDSVLSENEKVLCQLRESHQASLVQANGLRIVESDMSFEQKDDVGVDHDKPSVVPPDNSQARRKEVKNAAVITTRPTCCDRSTQTAQMELAPIANLGAVDGAQFISKPDQSKTEVRMCGKPVVAIGDDTVIAGASAHHVRHVESKFSVSRLAKRVDDAKRHIGKGPASRIPNSPWANDLPPVVTDRPEEITDLFYSLLQHPNTKTAVHSTHARPGSAPRPQSPLRAASASRLRSVEVARLHSFIRGELDKELGRDSRSDQQKRTDAVMNVISSGSAISRPASSEMHRSTMLREITTTACGPKSILALALAEKDGRATPC